MNFSSFGILRVVKLRTCVILMGNSWKRGTCYMVMGC
jgi:hypothetical protein